MNRHNLIPEAITELSAVIDFTLSHKLNNTSLTQYLNGELPRNDSGYEWFLEEARVMTS